jgi:hypothetical protein
VLSTQYEGKLDENTMVSMGLSASVFPFIPILLSVKGESIVNEEETVTVKESSPSA